MFYALFIPLQFNSIGFYSTFEKTTTAVKITVRNFYGDDNDNQKKKENDAFDLHSFLPHTKDGDSNYYNDFEVVLLYTFYTRSVPLYPGNDPLRMPGNLRYCVSIQQDSSQ